MAHEEDPIGHFCLAKFSQFDYVGAYTSRKSLLTPVSVRRKHGESRQTWRTENGE